ncbi:MAG: hypothetical protein P8181_03160, partial [bacterium]
MRRAVILGGLGWVALVMILTSFPFDTGYAVPSFSRQTGVTCASCHTVFPQLTDFGRSFKLHGYTMIGSTEGQTKRLEIGSFPPISAMVQTSYTSVQARVPGTQNGNALLPDQLSLFYAGRISDDLGAFMQITYDGVDDHFSMDNVDVRFARQAGEGFGNIVYGLTLNNNPTVSDLWNSTPAWGFPFASSELAPAPAAAAWIDGGFAQQVAGIGGYVSWKDMVYAEADVYRSFQIGGNAPPTADTENLIKGVMPYWRLALSHQKGEHDVEIGTFGLWTQLHPGGGEPLSGLTNDFLDIGVDAQYQWLHDNHTVTVHSTWIYEKQDWDAAFAANQVFHSSDDLNTFRVNGIYYYNRLIGGSLGFFSTTGDKDPLLYPLDPIDGSRTGDPESRGFLVEAAFVPWYNTRLSVLYTIYDR